MVALWILASLVIFAVGLGYRTMIDLRLARYQRDRLKASCLAKAGLNRAISEIKNDTNTFDSFQDSWADNENIFKSISPENNANESASVFYTTIDEYNKPKIVYGVADEERKININRTDNYGQLLIEGLLFSLTEVDAADASTLSEIAVEWMNPEVEPDIKKAIFKNAPLKTPEEFLLILEYFFQQKGLNPDDSRKQAGEIYDKIKDYVTVASEQKININTAERKTLEILINACIKFLRNQGGEVETDTQLLAVEIIKKRKQAPFATTDDLKPTDFAVADPNGTMIDEFKRSGLITVESQNFRIISVGEIKVHKIKKQINCVFNRENKALVYYYEN